uniref:Microsomal glutathione S-transferase 1 n=1 Tax=Hyaloperonospora arabidopsidis (strain Emoy2) TaxID=559515 RepID=M4B7E6_HYAAE
MNDITDVKAFALSAAVLYIKFLASTMIQGRKAFAANTRMPEDKALVCTLGLELDMDEKAVKTAREDEMRWKRIVQNDLESLPLALIVFWSAIAVGVASSVIKLLLLIYTTARVSHTAVYSMALPRARMACWMTGTLCVVATALYVVAMI